ncbi:TPA: maltose/maltodextrin ABC transporter ATP-binding protein MalK [Vibrio parahaemolyticus]|uniref:maltose/maltodextrin ABC transporter ATP-binding protein MalK n=1 Tax=Vibrio parahaemolyticus TaxID=670 RepID=UPI0007A0C077|nr:maltose/maltodextrin ABC transporter ATP-binding protein MalK [Vibrio parahaemolyticus]EGR1145341.1 maltose/maltodextrin ABC transporter ATP-binding protein MalK [Vibrio parahaemolyticus]EGR2359649.1 maltose/maltodextrin ABC transporter ATP-binding protein MalK [Vibrio parahaemolyticus]EGR3423943.1 maltose/maltodextrin ABC transporter ATP-binding protein MalK [Vibrio parahaemolyticus]EIS4857282.1 maltose/maltodextrin ABC transporter ATP-binding protein MalK [Vibrio parahaemolyticus]ELB16503
MASVTLKNVCKAYGDVLISKNVDLQIDEGEFVVFVGPSGCGKSTLLRCIAGLEDITSGDLYIGDQRMNDVEPSKRGVGMVFQSYALYPHLNLYDNMSFGLKLAKADKAEIDKRVEHAAEILQLGHLLERQPKALSGGQRQRVAIGRTLVSQPNVFLLDEPLSNLDAALRVNMRAQITKLQRQLGCTMIYVTHDQVEAMTMADKIVVLDGGYVSQVGKPLELYHYPQNRFVAGFIGSPKMNFMSVFIDEVESERVKVQLSNGVSFWIPVDGTTVNRGDRMSLGIRPEHLLSATEADATIHGEVMIVEKLGNETQVYLNLEGADADVIYRQPDTLAVDTSDKLEIGIPAHRCHLFHSDGRACKRLFKENGVDFE